MKEIRHHRENSSLTVFLEGHIDASNAPAAEAEVMRLLKDAPVGTLTLDCENLEYISSGGLRFILRLKKTVPDTRVIEASSEIYDIFEMTGFTEMMEVSRAFRRISLEGCEVIGSGANGTVYRLDPETIVKHYADDNALPEIRRERELARRAFVLGIPTAIPYDIVRIEGGGYGSVFELLNAASQASLLAKGEMSLDEAAEMNIRLLKQIHSTEVQPGQLPDMRDTVKKWAAFVKPYLEPELGEKLSALVEALPEDHHLLHGDYHMKNVMVQNGEALLIDMDTLCCGHPVYELAGMYNAYRGFGELDPSVTLSFHGLPYDLAGRFWKKAMELYFAGANDEAIKAAEEKAMILSYTRLMRRAIRRGGFENEAGRREIENCRRHLKYLLPRTETLIF